MSLLNLTNFKESRLDRAFVFVSPSPSHPTSAYLSSPKTRSVTFSKDNPSIHFDTQALLITGCSLYYSIYDNSPQL